jgi:hypothetical protein
MNNSRFDLKNCLLTFLNSFFTFIPFPFSLSFADFRWLPIRWRGVVVNLVALKGAF